PADEAHAAKTERGDALTRVAERSCLHRIASRVESVAGPVPMGDGELTEWQTIADGPPLVLRAGIKLMRSRALRGPASSGGSRDSTFSFSRSPCSFCAAFRLHGAGVDRLH